MSKTSVISTVFLSLLPWVAFAQSGSEPPAVSRASDDAAALAAPEITPQMYGAKGDGKADDTKPLSAALNAGRPVRCAGKFRIISKISVALRNAGQELDLEGSGRAGCVIIEDGADAFIEVRLFHIDNPFGPDTNHVTLRHATLAPNTHVAHGAIELYGIPASGSTEPTLYAEDFNVVPTATTNFSNYGIYLKDMRNLTIASSMIEGRYGSFNGDGIHITSSKGSAPVDFHLHDNIISWWNIGLALAPNVDGVKTGANDWEGAYVTNNTFLADNIGVSAKTVDNSASLLTITGNHMNFSQYGIYAVDVQQLYASDNFFLDSSVGVNAPSETYGIYDFMDDNVAQYGHLTDNSFDFTGALAVKTRHDIYAGHSGVTPLATTIHGNTSIGASAKFSGMETTPRDNTAY